MILAIDIGNTTTKMKAWLTAFVLFLAGCSAPGYIIGTESRGSTDHVMGWSQDGAKLFLLRHVIYKLPKSPTITPLDFLRPPEDLYQIVREECFVDELNPASRQLITLYAAPCLLPEPLEYAVVSPDGRKLAYTTPTALIVRNLLTGRVLLTRRGAIQQLGWGADSTWIVYRSADKLLVNSVDGSTPSGSSREVFPGGPEAAQLSAVRQATVEWKSNDPLDTAIFIKDPVNGRSLRETTTTYWRLPKNYVGKGIELCGGASPVIINGHPAPRKSLQTTCYASGDARYLVAGVYDGFNNKGYDWLVVNTENGESAYVRDHRKWNWVRKTRLGF